MNDSTWTWMSGSDSVNQLPVYGVKGIPSPNNRPSARYAATGCYDSITQEFWLFGGYGRDKTNEEGMHEKSCKLS